MSKILLFKDGTMTVVTNAWTVAAHPGEECDISYTRDGMKRCVGIKLTMPEFMERLATPFPRNDVTHSGAIAVTNSGHSDCVDLTDVSNRP